MGIERVPPPWARTFQCFWCLWPVVRFDFDGSVCIYVFVYKFMSSVADRADLLHSPVPLSLPLPHPFHLHLHVKAQIYNFRLRRPSDGQCNAQNNKKRKGSREEKSHRQKGKGKDLAADRQQLHLQFQPGQKRVRLRFELSKSMNYDFWLKLSYCNSIYYKCGRYCAPCTHPPMPSVSVSLTHTHSPPLSVSVVACTGHWTMSSWRGQISVYTCVCVCVYEPFRHFC